MHHHVDRRLRDEELILRRSLLLFRSALHSRSSSARFSATSLAPKRWAYAMAAEMPAHRGLQSSEHTGYIGFSELGHPKHSEPHRDSILRRLVLLPPVGSTHFLWISLELSRRKRARTLSLSPRDSRGQGVSVPQPVRRLAICFSNLLKRCFDTLRSRTPSGSCGHCQRRARPPRSAAPALGCSASEASRRRSACCWAWP